MSSSWTLKSLNCQCLTDLSHSPRERRGFVAGKCLQTHLKPPWNRTFKFYNKYAMHMLCRYAWHSDPLKFSIPQRENALRSFDPYVISENMPPIHHTSLKLHQFFQDSEAMDMLINALVTSKWLVSKPKPSPQLPWCSVWLGTEVAAMATLSTASCLSIATAHGWIYELSSFKPCQTCRFQTFREGCLPTTCVFLHGNLWQGIAQSVRSLLQWKIQAMRPSICNNLWFNMFNKTAAVKLPMMASFLEPFRGQKSQTCRRQILAWRNCHKWQSSKDQQNLKTHLFHEKTPKKPIRNSHLQGIRICPWWVHWKNQKT